MIVKLRTRVHKTLTVLGFESKISDQNGLFSMESRAFDSTNPDLLVYILSLYSVAWPRPWPQEQSQGLFDRSSGLYTYILSKFTDMG